MLKYLKQKLNVKEAGVALYRRENGYFLHPNDITDVGIRIANEPCTEMALEASYEEIGNIIRENLLRSRTNIEHPKEFKGIFNFVLKKAKVRSYKQFMIDCRYCSIQQKGSKLLFAHSINNGSKGFAFTGDPGIEIDISSTDQELGRLAIECLEKSK
jgi:hypothetical protein